ncbi:MAG TPA: two-component regulator propeller domain-containing protein [Chitinophagaceae bacterium]|nr:two-component regulator propeller domain-containing protein [Chitinophagaceae bacterium]
MKPVELFAQLKHAEFHKLSVQNGLSSDFTKSIIQDRHGFYWIATSDGLNRFDGTSFRVFRYDKNDTASLSHNLCMIVMEDRKGDIWVGTQKGVSRYQKKKDKFRRYYFHHTKFKDDIINPVYTLMEDNDGNIWVANYGLWKINPRNDEIKSYNFEDKPTALSDASQTWNAEYDSTANGIWISTAYHLNFFSLERNTFFNSSNNPLHWKVFDLPEKNPFFTCHNGTLWLYAEPYKMFYTFISKENKLQTTPLAFEKKADGISNDKEGNILFRFAAMPAIIYRPGSASMDTIPAVPEINFSDDGGLVNSFYTDHSGNKWLCAKKGVVVARKQENAVTIHKLTGKSIPLPSSRRICCLNDSSIIIGTGKGLYNYNPLNRVSIPVSGKDFQHNITALLNAGDSILWVATSEAAILHYDLKKKKITRKVPMPSPVFFFLADRFRSFWAGSWDEGLYEMDGKGNILTHFVQGKGFSHQGYFLGGFYDGADEIWMGLNGGNGFAKLDLKNRQFKHFKIKSDHDNDFGLNSVNAILKDKNNNVWLGTYGSGLFYFNQGTGHFKNYNRSDGLSGDFINSLTFDTRGNLWVSTNTGIDILNLKDTSFSHINTKIEFDDNGFVNNLHKYKNNLYYISNGKLTVINPEKLSSNNQSANIIISGLKISGNEINAKHGEALTLKYNENFINLEFSVLKVSPDIPAEYKYKLEGFDPDWNYSGRRGIANYTNVPPGKYVLLLNATNESGIWNTEPVSLSITISPPFWKTWWFKVLAIIIFSGAVYGIVRYRFLQINKRQKRQLALVVDTQEKEKKSISAQLHDDLGVRLSALKFFVSSLKQYLQPGDSKADEIYAKSISAIDESVEDIRYLLINLSPKTLNEYGYLMAVEDLVNKLRRLHIIDVELSQKELEQRLTPETESGLYRITQELINNTLKHAQAQTIRLHIEKKDGNILLNYSDDGKGFDIARSSTGYGLENIHTRVALLNGRIEWQHSGGKITGVNIIIPSTHT